MKIQGGDKYRVPIISSKCHREEVIFDMVSAIDHLDAVTTEIFSKIQERLTQQRADVTALTSRLGNASAKLASLKSSSKPIHILSPAKFPESSESNGMPKCFDSIVLQQLDGGKYRTDAAAFPSRQKSYRGPIQSKVEQTDELLQHHRVRNTTYLRGSSVSQLGVKYEVGLGDPPDGLEYLDSYYLFNTNINPYQNYIIPESGGEVGPVGSSSIKGGHKVTPSSAETTENAKKDLSNDSVQSNNDGPDDFYYYPTSVQVPQIDLPEHLPSLPGLSEAFSCDLPSDPIRFSSQPAVNPTVPDLNHGANTTSDTVQMLSSATTPAFVPPTPPPLPPASLMSSPFPSAGLPANTYMAAPLPPPMPLLISAETVSSGPLVRAPAQTESTDSRSALMAAIRGAGGKSKLKSATKADADNPSNGTVGGAGGDLLEDLKNSLAMRRRGISGHCDTGKSTGIGEIMKKIASSIPLVVDDDSFDPRKASLSEDDDDWD